MKCSIHGCPGDYEANEIVHTVERRGEVVVIEHVPAQVCSVCGDVLLGADTVRHIENLLTGRRRPTRTAPVYEYV